MGSNTHRFASPNPANIPQVHHYVPPVGAVDKAANTPLEPLIDGEKEEQGVIQDTLPFDRPSSYGANTPASTYSHIGEIFPVPIAQKDKFRHDGDARKRITR
jgi:hypothetical protein